MGLILNDELKKSISTNELNINITDYDYLKMELIISKLTNKYDDVLSKINKMYEDRNIDIMDIHCNIVHDVIKDVLSYYDEIKKYDVCVFLIGSFSRCTNKMNSDLDLSFSYDKKYYNEMFKYEEMIYYIISSVLKMDRKKNHSMLVSRLSKDNMDEIESLIDDNKLVVNLISNEGVISYTYNANEKRRVYLQYGNDKSLDNIFSYLKNEVMTNNSEWAHVFKVFTNDLEFNNRYDELYEYEKSIKSDKSIDNRCNIIKNKILTINNNLNNIDRNNISEFKNLFQKKELDLIYDYILLIRDKYILDGYDWKYLNIKKDYDLLSKDYVFNFCIDYMFYLFDIASKYKDKYSIHSNDYVLIEEFDEIFNKIVKLNNKIMLSLGGMYESNSYNANRTI